MNPEEIKQASQKKVNQITDLMELLHVRVEARERVGKDGFIHNGVVWIDDEVYPNPPPLAPEDLPNFDKTEPHV
jgi:hypothetical protein